MPVVLTSAWGGCTVSHSVTRTLWEASAAAGGRGDPQVRPRDILAVLARSWQGPARIGVILAEAGDRLVGVPAASRVVEPFRPGDAESVPSADLLETLAGLDSWSSSTGASAHATTLHLLAALLSSADPEMAALREAGFTADLILIAAARDPGRSADEDDAFAAVPVTAELSVPDAPTPEDLSIRTGAPLSPSMHRMYRATLPSGTRVNTPLGMVRIRRWSWLIALQTLGFGYALLPIWELITEDWWWALEIPLIAPFMIFEVIPLWAGIPGLAVAVLFGPPSLQVTVTALALIACAKASIEVWMKRVDLSAPDLRLSTLRRETWRVSMSSGRQLAGVPDEED
jgi:hypothetical protein